MITKEELKREVDRLPESLLDEVYALLKNISVKPPQENNKWTQRDFHGKLDKVDIRSSAYE